MRLEGVPHGVLHQAMVSKTSTVRSIRLPNTTWEWLTKQAAVEGVTVNALVASMLDPGKPSEVQIKPVDPEPTVWPSGAVLLPEHTKDPGPASAGPHVMRRPAVPYGSRLKGTKK